MTVIREAPPIWEPWRPRVGDHVRVRVSPECPEAHFAHNPACRGAERILWHLTATREETRRVLDGAIGVVQGTHCTDWPCGQGGLSEDDPPCDRDHPCWLHDSGHFYFVADHTPATGDRCVIVNDWFAAVELEPTEERMKWE